MEEIKQAPTHSSNASCVAMPHLQFACVLSDSTGKCTQNVSDEGACLGGKLLNGVPYSIEMRIQKRLSK